MSRTDLPVVPIAVVVIVAMGLSVTYLGADSLLGRPSHALLNQLGPGTLLTTCLWAAYSLVRVNPLAVWSPMPWFLAACAVFFGFGPLAYYFATPESVAFMDSYYPVDERLLLRTNLLSSIGVGVACLAAAAGVPAVQPAWARRGRYNHAETKLVMWLFLTIGGTVKYLFAFPYALGLLAWTLPGGIQHLSSLLGAAITLLFVMIYQGHKSYRWLLWPLIASEIISSLMTFAKIELMLTVFAVILGWYLCRPSMRALMWSGVFLILLYVLVLSPFVGFARIAINVTGTDDPRALAGGIAEYAVTSREDLAVALPGVQGWWTRLSYSNAQGFAMDGYDGGARGDTFSLIPYTLVPRVIVPAKPIMTTGKDFSVLVTGSDSFASAPGVFGEAYWNGGWPAVALVSLYVGAVLAIAGRFSMDWIAARRYVFLPVIMIGIVSGLRPDSWFVPSYIGAAVEAIFFYVVLRGVLWLRGGPGPSETAAEIGR